MKNYVKIIILPNQMIIRKQQLKQQNSFKIYIYIFNMYNWENNKFEEIEINI